MVVISYGTPMKRLLADSSSIRSFGYDHSSAVLEIEYRNGLVYQYEQVPESIYRLLRGAPSLGGFVNRVVKPNFDAHRVAIREGGLRELCVVRNSGKTKA